MRSTTLVSLSQCGAERHIAYAESYTDARRWVNKMCLASDAPLIESGTAGFIGQVQPIKKVR